MVFKYSWNFTPKNIITFIALSWMLGSTVRTTMRKYRMEKILYLCETDILDEQFINDVNQA